MRTRWFHLLSLLALPALAQSKPSLVDYPLDVKVPVSNAVLTSLEEDFRIALARQKGVMVSTKSNWKSAVAALKRQDCELRDECLKQLAVGAGTLYAIYASVERNAAGTEVTATGRVVNQDGVQARPATRVTVPLKTNISEAAKDALAQLIEKLDLSGLPAVLSEPKKETPPVVADAPVKQPNSSEPTVIMLPPPPSPPAAETGTSGTQIAGYVFGGGAIVAAGVAAGFGFTALSSKSSLPVDGHLTEDQAKTQASVNQGATIALGAGIAAGVLAAASITCFAISGPSSASNVALVPTPHGAALTFGGSF